MARGVRDAENSQGIRKANRWTDALEHTREDGEGVVRPDAEAGDERPQGKPRQSDDEHELVAENVTETAGEEDESADGERVAADEPGETWWVGDVEGLANCAEEDQCSQIRRLCSLLAGVQVFR